MLEAVDVYFIANTYLSFQATFLVLVVHIAFQCFHAPCYCCSHELYAFHQSQVCMSPLRALCIPETARARLSIGAANGDSRQEYVEYWGSCHDILLGIVSERQWQYIHIPEPLWLWYIETQSCKYSTTLTWSLPTFIQLKGCYDERFSTRKGKGDVKHLLTNWGLSLPNFWSVVAQYVWKYPILHKPIVQEYCWSLHKIDSGCDDLLCQILEPSC